MKIVPRKLPRVSIVDLAPNGAGEPDDAGGVGNVAVEPADYNRRLVGVGKVPVEFPATPDRVGESDVDDHAIVSAGGLNVVAV